MIKIEKDQKLYIDGLTMIDTGAYTTIANNNAYGYLISQITTGESYNKIADGTGGYVQKTVGTYTTTASSIDAFGTVLVNTTIGKSQKLDIDGLTMIETGA